MQFSGYNAEQARRRKELESKLLPLQAELSKLRQEEIKAEEDAKIAFGKKLLKNIDFLIDFAGHTGDCSDANAVNTRGCERCALLKLKAESAWQTEWPFGQINVDIIISV